MNLNLWKHLRSDQRGVSLLELLVGVGILGILGLLASRNLSTVSKLSSKIDVARIAIIEVENILSLIKKDYEVKERGWFDKLSELPGSCKPGQSYCRDFSIQRKDKNGNIMNMRYQSSCQEIIPTSLLTKSRLDYKKAANKDEAKCISNALKCPMGKMPVVKLIKNGKVIRTWPSPQRKQLHKMAHKAPLGVALCLVTPSPTGVQVLLEAIYLNRFNDSENNNGYLKIISKKDFQAEKATSDIQYLP